MDSRVLPDGSMEELEARMVRAIKQMRRFEVLREIPILLVVENAPGPIAPMVSYIIDNYNAHTKTGTLGNLIMLRECGKDLKRGVPKNAENTDAMVRFGSVRMKENRVHFSDVLSVGENQTPDELIEKLLKQMDGFKLQQKTKNDRFAEAQFKWLGDDKDDLMVSFLENMFWERHFWMSNRMDYEQEKLRL